MAYDASPPAEVTARDRVIMLRDFLAKLPPRRFDMNACGSVEDADEGDCGAPACIGGWARALFRVNNVDLDSIGTDVLGLSERHMRALFYPVGYGAGYTNGGRMGNGRKASAATPAQAVQVLDHYLTAGKIDWSAAK